MDKKVQCPKCLGFVYTGNFFGKCDRCNGAGQISKTEIPVNKGQNASKTD